MVRCMHRTNIYLEERQTAALDEVARREGVTRAEVVRRLIDQGLAEGSAVLERDLEAIEASFGVLAADDAPGPERTRSARQDHLDRLWDR